ncbi:MAG TPA: 2-oxoacid:acceptor oxidoreductase subunit alpha, partial [Chloroflexota bacterium]|nr:2-oxoacid:acceptor oxidoreductase subunit alpha [Chloroflexota bacterium]
RAGDGHQLHVTGLTHDERGYPATDAATHERLVRRLSAKVHHASPHLVDAREMGVDDAEVVVIAYGGAARSAMRAVSAARAAGLRAGLFRPITLWPFPAERIAALGRRNVPIVVAEMNLGQFAREVERHIRREVRTVTHAGGLLLPPDQILTALREAHQHR